MRITTIAFVLGLWGCGGDKPPEVDADPNGPRSTGAVFDVCATEHDCMSGNCHVFATQGFQV